MRKTLTTLALTGTLVGLAPAIPAQAIGGCHSVDWGQIPVKQWNKLLYHGWHGIPGDGHPRLYSPDCFAWPV